MNYQERVQRALDQVDESPFDMSEGDSFVEDGFLIECIYSKEENLPYPDSSSRENYYVCIEQTTNYVHFHYGRDYYDIDRYGEKNYRDDWGFALPMFCKVGQLIQPYYQSWLDKKGYELEDKELDEAPWCIDVLKKKED